MFSRSYDRSCTRLSGVKLSISNCAQKRIWKAAISLAFILAFSFSLAVLSVWNTKSGVVGTGAFSRGFTLYALIYDCSVDNSVAALSSDLMELERAGIALVLPSEIKGASSDCAVILIKNAPLLGDKALAIWGDGFKAALVIAPECVSGCAEEYRELLSCGSFEVCSILNECENNNDPNTLASVFAAKLELIAKLGIESNSCLLNTGLDADDLSRLAKVANEHVIFTYGSGMNRIDQYSEKTNRYSVFERKSAAPLSECFEGAFD